jgi:hypothetical protein
MSIKLYNTEGDMHEGLKQGKYLEDWNWYVEDSEEDVVDWREYNSRTFWHGINKEWITVTNCIQTELGTILVPLKTYLMRYPERKVEAMQAAKEYATAYIESQRGEEE